VGDLGGNVKGGCCRCARGCVENGARLNSSTYAPGVALVDDCGGAMGEFGPVFNCGW
jgi:hypothetical protein